jgi:glycosyltransferase involved in cell wall biosynthesis
LGGGWAPGRLLVSAALPPVGAPAALDRRLLRRAGGVIAFGEAEAPRYRRQGVPAERITVVSRAIKGCEPAPEPAQVPGVHDGLRVLLGVGPLELHKGFREAVWAFDILHHLYPDVHLVLAGGGSDRPRVEQFARAIGVMPQVHFTGPCPSTAALLQRAEIAWVPSLRGGGACAALEAMAAGRPVVATRLPALGEVVVDGETGFLVAPDDKAALARQTRLLLDDEECRRRFGAAGRRRALEHFSVPRLAEACARLYLAR